MITPDHRGLKQLDIALMKAVHNMVNIFPILAKADTYTNQELAEMKRRVINDLNANEIKIYEFPECDSDDNPEFVKLNEEMKKLVPFSVVGSLETVPVAGKTVRGRKYPWGFVEIDDPMNSEFPYLKKMLFRTHTHDLRDITSDVHYESYRTKILTSGNHFTVNIIDKDTGSDTSPF
ncbi:Septin-1 [Thelohanellus kitauei]|uniref:Septin-1 n=1 Tax=Thelohanellus kitauei TaxID=669202 RepID=A0A0C2MBG4_THEKT|nr:Septin-1 [Thelohanellus kitauei]